MKASALSLESVATIRQAYFYSFKESQSSRNQLTCEAVIVQIYATEVRKIRKSHWNLAYWTNTALDDEIFFKSEIFVCSTFNKVVEQVEPFNLLQLENGLG